MTNQFGQFNLKTEIVKAIDGISFNKPTKVQKRIIPPIIAGRDVVGQSQTGSGKTHAFLLPIFNGLDPSLEETQAVIASPSRELAEQLYQAFRDFQKSLAAIDENFADLRIADYIGGTDRNKQIRQLERKQPQIAIGTPGRLKDFLSKNFLLVNQNRFFVVDEADMALDMGFLEDVDTIASAMPDNLQMLVFSATIPDKLTPFLKRYMKNPLIEEIPVSTVVADTIDNYLLATKSKDKNEVIFDLLTRKESYLTLVFANTKERVHELAHFLDSQGLKAAEVHGGIEPRERRRTMKRIKKQEFQYVVATDLAARGLDIQGVSEVINDDIPTDLEFFIHRVGRTGRNGLPGTAITLYGPDEEDKVEELEKLGINFQAKQLKDHQLIDVKDRNRRARRRPSQKQLDPELVGLVKKKKAHVKPGYRRQIKGTIRFKQMKENKVSQRTASRAARKAKKNR
ncbi:DEAD/DEAH box helicase [Oenococcus oeni]|uniref:DEAD/DEAH box helicase n=1 Tax=Oenococcus oeni TaxID=1247 RepID=UPI00050E0122|nr:DEAD/DEAH box helicase [Oenococcus oeni]KGH81981.1 DEAD/DEAH box helicase [Oenococcus oeni S14]